MSYRKKDVIGCGAFGKVYSAKCIDNKKQIPKLDLSHVAIKRNFVELQSDFIGTIREFDFLKRMNHPNIMNVIDYGYDNPFEGNLTPTLKKNRHKDDHIFFVMEKANFSVEELLFTEDSKQKDIKRAEFLHDKYDLRWDHYKTIMYQTALAVEHLHLSGIMHRDIKAFNVLVYMNPPYGRGIRNGFIKKRGRKPNLDVSESTDVQAEVDESLPLLTAKLCDFGASKFVNNQGNLTHRNVYTSWYMAPEVLMEAEYSYPADMWSLGIFFFEMIRNQPIVLSRDDDPESIFSELLRKFPYYIDLKKQTEMINLIGMKKLMNIKRRDKPSDERRNWKELMHVDPDIEMEFNGCEGTMDQFVDLINGILQMNPSRRLSASEVVMHPFFDGYRTHTNLEIPLDMGDFPITQSNSPSREYFVNMMTKTYKIKKNIDWWKDSIIFHTIDLFERYLLTNPDIEKRELQECVVGCIYIFIKYFGDNKREFKDVITAEHYNPEKALQFEKDIMDKFGGELFRGTVYEYHRKLTPKEVDALFDFVISNKANGMTRQEIWKAVIG